MIRLLLTRFRKRDDFLLALLSFVVVLLVYVNSSNTPLSDSLWAVHISSSLLNTGDIDLDEFEQFVDIANNFGVLSKKVDGRILPYFPIGNSIIGAPVLWVMARIYPPPEQQNLYQYLQENSPSDPYLIWIQHLVAAFITALIAPVVYLIGREQHRKRVAFVAVLLFAFGSSAYSVASRVLWQHGPSMLMIALVLLLFLRGQKNPRYIRWAGIPLAFSYVVRPTNSLSIIVLTLFVLLYHRKQLFGYLLGAAIVAVPFMLFNQVVYQQWLSPYYLPQRVGSSPLFWEALAGNVISPSRGLFVYSPILLFVGHGIVVKLRQSKWHPLDTAFLLIILLHWLLISSFGHWWGGHSYGPRFFTDILPYFFYLLLPSLNWLLSSSAKFSFVRVVGIVVFVLFALVSVAIHYVGANEKGINAWNNIPVGLDSHASVRLWNWSDLQFLRTVDDWPILATGYELLVNRQTYEPNLLLPLHLQNVAELPYSWEVKVPNSVSVIGNADVVYTKTSSGIPIVIGKDMLQPDEVQGLQLPVMINIAEIDDLSLGAVMVTSRNAQGEDVGIQIVPISVGENGRNWQSSFAISSRIWLPEDITVNGTKPTSELYALFGTGWYLLEKLDPYSWRWAASPAELYVFAGEAQEATLSFTMSEMYEATSENGLGDTAVLQITVGEQQFREDIVRGQPNEIPLSLASGWNVLTFELASGNFQPSEMDASSSDRRVLSFAMSSFEFKTDD